MPNMQEWADKIADAIEGARNDGYAVFNLHERGDVDTLTIGYQDPADRDEQDIAIADVTL